MDKTCDHYDKAMSRWAWIALAIVIAFVFFVRFRLLDVPLERDEGEYAYAGQLMLQGIPPYSQIYNMKLPGIYAAYAVIEAVFGQSVTGIRLGLLVMNAATIVLMFFLTRRLFDSLTAAASAAVFALLTLAQKSEGIFANAEHFVIFLGVAGLLLLLRAIGNRKILTLFLAGFALGLSVMMKQHGVLFVAFAGVVLLVSELRGRPLKGKPIIGRLALFVLAAILPFILTCLIMYGLGVFDKFWFWTFAYAWRYVSKLSVSRAPEALYTNAWPIVASQVLLWMLAAVGMVSLFVNKNYRDSRLFVTLFLVFSFVAVSLGFYYRPHYFILLAPAVALAAGVGFTWLALLFNKAPDRTLLTPTTAIAAAVVFGYSVYQQHVYFFKSSPHVVIRSTYGMNPFLESVEIGRYIDENAAKDARIVVFGSEPQIYFYSKRKSATGYIYMYGLMAEGQFAGKMQQEMIKEIEEAAPEYIVLVSEAIRTSWLGRPDFLMDWFHNMSERQYELVGTVDMLSPSETNYVWGPKASSYISQSEMLVKVLRRRAL